MKIRVANRGKIEVVENVANVERTLFDIILTMENGEIRKLPCINYDFLGCCK